MRLITSAFERILAREPAAVLVMLAVLAARLFLKKAPKRLTLLLWAVVWARLLLPVSLQAPVSLVPRAALDAGSVLQSAASASAPQSAPAAASQGLEAAQTVAARPAASIAAPSFLSIAATLWALGMAALVVIQLVKLLRLRRALSGAEGLAPGVFLSQKISSAFVFGLLRPRIYLSAALSEEQRRLVLLHETMHIRRLDHVWKWLAFLALAIHWFDPLVWLCYGLFGRDLELSCDEAVTRQLTQAERCDYAQTLLALSSPALRFPLPSFSQPEPAGRIRRILSWKRPKTLLCLLALVLVVGLGAGLLVDRSPGQDVFGRRYQVSRQLYAAPMFSSGYTSETLPSFALSGEQALYERQVGGSFNERGYFRARTHLSGSELLPLFESYFLTDETTSMLLRVKDGWLCETSTRGSEFYLLMPSGSELLLAVGYGYETEHMFVRFLFTLEEDTRRFAPEELTDMIAESISLAPRESIQIYSYYELESLPNHLFAAFDGAHSGYALFSYDGAISGYRLKGRTSWSGSQALFSETMSLYDEEACYTVVLSHREDLALVTATLGDVRQEEAATACPAMLIFEWDELPPDAHPEVHFYSAASEELSRD